MTKENKLGIIVAVVIVAVLVLSSLQLRQHTCEVCITFGGHTNCAIASGTTRKEAQGSQPLGSGVPSAAQGSQT